MEWHEIEGKLRRAREQFLDEDRGLLEVNANERSMTHKFAEHLQREVPEWSVDCEYNRNGGVPKQLLCSMSNQRVCPADEDGRTVFPDIIVHHRGTQDNLLVIEAKKSSNDSSDDRKKLEAFMTDERYKYRFAVVLRFVIKEPFDVKIDPWTPSS